MSIERANTMHESHQAMINRLKRADGHLNSVIAMLEEGRSCSDIALQLHAVERAISQAKRTLIHDHLDHCLDDIEHKSPAEQRTELEDFKQITRYL